jgi:DnaJ-class molecular chaperone
VPFIEDAMPAWCEFLGVDRRATRAQIVAAYWERAKAAHPDFGDPHEVMTALMRAVMRN